MRLVQKLAFIQVLVSCVLYVCSAWLLPAHAGSLLIPVGESHNCVALDNGSVQCWGRNESGQLGNNSTVDSSNPVVVAGINNATLVSVGYHHSCAVLASGAVQCWGMNNYGQLGLGATVTSPTAIAAGGFHTCAVLASGAVQCLGHNGSGQLGNGSKVNSADPVVVAGIDSAIAIAAGTYHTCAVLRSGGVQCWGGNDTGQLGNASTTDSAAPVTVTGISTAISVTAGRNHSCALLRSGGVQCWGSNSNGQLGNGQVSDSASPVAVQGIASAKSIAVGTGHSCAVLESGAVQCWGSNRYGQLGNGSTGDSQIPVPMSGIGNAKSVMAGYYHTCVGLLSGGVRCAGENSYGQLGNASNMDSLVPVTVVGANGTAALDLKEAAKLLSLSVSGPGTLKSTGTATLAATATYANAKSLTVTPVWKSSKPAVASVDAGGNLIAARVRTDTPVTLSASFTENGITVTASLQVTVLALPLDSLSVNGPSKLQSAGSAALVATAHYADNTTQAVAAVWSSSNPDLASVGAAGVLTAGSVAVDTPVQLTASYTENGVTTKASLQVTITAVPASLTGLQLLGAGSLQAGAQTRLAVKALYSDGSSRTVAASSYALSNDALGSVNASRGVLTVANVTLDTALTITASYTEDGVTRTASLVVNIAAAPAVLKRLSLVGTQGTLASGQSLNLSAQGVYADGSRKTVNATWSVLGTAASISSAGVLTMQAVAQDTRAVVSASYTEAGVTVGAEFQVLLQAAVAVPTPIATEVETTGVRSDFGLAIWSSLNLAKAGGSQRGTIQASETGKPTYKMFVAALLPGGGIVSSPTVFMLNRNAEWKLASFPLAEYLAGVSDSSTQLVELFDHLDASLIAGTQIFIGYGITDTEMIEAGRFRKVYELQ